GFLNIDALTFTDSAFTGIFLDPAQFDSGKISDNLLVTGVSTAADRIAIVLPSGGGSFSAAGWRFRNWNSGVDLTGGGDVVSLQGGFDSDTLIGSSQRDRFENIRGADTMTGGRGSDLFNFVTGLGTPLALGGSGAAGTISGFVTVTDF